jgi:hypothetical protein
VPDLPGRGYACAMTEPTLDVRCGRSGDTLGGWLCLVKTHDGPFSTEHRVTVAPAILERLDPGAAGPERLVAAAFAFLLEREPASSILRTFDLSVIGRYFPDWEADVIRRLSG